jgi:hypothetical protein
MNDQQRKALAGVAALTGLCVIASGIYEAYERRLPLADGLLVGDWSAHFTEPVCHG